LARCSTLSGRCRFDQEWLPQEPCESRTAHAKTGLQVIPRKDVKPGMRSADLEPAFSPVTRRTLTIEIMARSSTRTQSSMPFSLTVSCPAQCACRLMLWPTNSPNTKLHVHCSGMSLHVKSSMWARKEKGLVSRFVFQHTDREPVPAIADIACVHESKKLPASIGSMAQS
jgi:hypothetical protein